MIKKVNFTPVQTRKMSYSEKDPSTGCTINGSPFLDDLYEEQILEAQLSDMNKDVEDVNFLQQIDEEKEAKYEEQNIYNCLVENVNYAERINHQNGTILINIISDPSDVQKSSENVLIQYPPLSRKYKSNPDKKNNQPKFLLRLFCQNIQKEQETYKQNLDIFETVKQKAFRLYQWMIESKRHHVSLNHLKMFFGTNSVSEKQSFLNRVAMMRILKKTLKKEVLENTQVKKKNHYLQAAKVYLLRLMNSKLSERIQCQ